MLYLDQNRLNLPVSQPEWVWTCRAHKGEGPLISPCGFHQVWTLPSQEDNHIIVEECGHTFSNMWKKETNNFCCIGETYIYCKKRKERALLAREVWEEQNGGRFRLVWTFKGYTKPLFISTILLTMPKSTSLSPSLLQLCGAEPRGFTAWDVDAWGSWSSCHVWWVKWEEGGLLCWTINRPDADLTWFQLLYTQHSEKDWLCRSD